MAKPNTTTLPPGGGKWVIERVNLPAIKGVVMNLWDNACEVKTESGQIAIIPANVIVTCWMVEETE